MDLIEKKCVRCSVGGIEYLIGTTINKLVMCICGIQLSIKNECPYYGCSK